MDNILYEIWLNTIKGIGPYLVRNLLETFGCAQAIYQCQLKELMQAPNIGIRKAELIYNKKKLETAKELAEYCVQHGILVISCLHPLYPPILHQYLKSPTLLYVRGNLQPLAYMESAAIAGARRCSEYGKEATTTLAHNLSRQNIAIISGMAKGIDGYAHTAAIKAAGYTVAVVGTGPEKCYPSEHQELMNAIIETGAVISQFPPLSEVPKQNFIKRNRLIAMLSNQIYIMEATRSSGSLYTAQCGFEYKKQVFALPGNIYDPLSEGSNNLIAQGAQIYLPILKAQEFVSCAISSDPFVEKVIKLLAKAPLSIEDINSQLKFEYDHLQEILLTLELEDKIKCIAGLWGVPKP